STGRVKRKETMREKRYETANERLKAWRAKQRNVSSETIESETIDETIEPTVSPLLVDDLERRDVDKYPNAKAWEVAGERTIRARRYAQKFPHFIHGAAWVFQSLAWQYEHEGLPTVERSRSSSRLVLA